MITLCKIPCPPLVTKANWAAFRATFASHTKIELPRLIPPFKTDVRGIATIHAVLNGRGYDANLFDVETLLSPSLIMMPRRAGVILPIHPAFASELLSRPDDMLPFPVGEEALLRLEKAYFRKPTHSKSMSAGMPVAFYESQSGRGVIGCARITSLRITDCENALKLYRNHGVLREAELANYADKQGRVQVITFDSFKPFSRPVPMKRLQELGCAKANLVGPEILKDEQLCRIVQEGMGAPFRDVLLSIQPDFVAKILNGKKTVELRKKPFPANGGTRVWIYSTSPTSAVEAVVHVDAVECDTPENIWHKFQNKIGISRSDFDAYFSGSAEAYALNISNPEKLERRVKLDEIRTLSEGFTPPQYYRYVEHNTKLFDTLVSIASMRAVIGS
jgi:predicted transcriptional regulator